MADASNGSNNLLANGARSNGHSNGSPAGPQAYGGTAPGLGLEQLRETLRILWRDKWVMLAVVVLVAGGVTAYTFWLPDVYQASTLLLVEPEQGGGSSAQFRLQASGFMRGDDSQLANELLVVRQSKELKRRVARRLMELKDIPETGEPLQILRRQNGEQHSVEEMIGLLPRHVSAQRAGPDVDAISISATSTQPGEAAVLANVYSREYIERAREKSRADLRGSRSFLERQATRLQGRLDSLEQELSDYMSENSAAALDEEASRTVKQIADLEAQRDEAQIELEMKQAALQAKEEELAKIEPRLVERAASSVEAELQKVQESLATKEMRLEQIYEENPALRENPDAGTRDIQQEVERLRERAQALSEQYIEEALSVGGVDPTPGREGAQGLSYVAQQQREAAQQRIAISGLKAKVHTLNQRLAEYRKNLETIPQQSIELAQIKRARQSAEKLYTFIIEKLQETRIAEQSEIGYAEIVHPADVPTFPFRPRKRRNVVLGLVLGLVLGSGLVLLRERLDTCLRRPDDLVESGYDLAGVVPDMTPLIESDFDGQELVTVDDREVSTGLSMLLSPMSASAEAYRRLRNTIQFSRPDTVVQALMVTSANAGEGKTTTALNVAIAMAQANRRTIVVDTDLHRPMSHKALGQRGEPGLTDVLFERSPLEQACVDTGIDNLTLLPAGREVPKPAELLGSKKMRALIEGLREEYDIIVLDTAPVGLLSDAMLLSTQCEGTLMVARAGKTDGRSFAHAVGTLNGVGGHLIGGVLNGFDASSEGYGYYGYYGDYGYGAYREAGRTSYRTEGRPERSALRSA